MSSNQAASVRARLLNVAKAQGVDFNQALAICFAVPLLQSHHGTNTSMEMKISQKSEFLRLSAVDRDDGAVDVTRLA